MSHITHLCSAVLFLFTTVFTTVYKSARIANYFPNSDPIELAQDSISLLHTLSIIVSPIFINTTENCYELNIFSSIYFGWDTLIILLLTFSKHWKYLFHHAITLFFLAGSRPTLGWYNCNLNFTPFYYAELSNILLVVWSRYRENRSISNTYRTLTPYFFITYVPIRIGPFTWYCIISIIDIWTNNTFNTILWNLVLTTPIVGIVLLSYFYSWKITTITWRTLAITIANPKRALCGGIRIPKNDSYVPSVPPTAPRNAT